MKLTFYAGLSGKTALLFLTGFVLVILPINAIVYNKLKTTITNADSQQLLAEAEKLISQVKLDPVTVPLPSPGHSIHIQVFNGHSFYSIFESPNFPMMSNELYFLHMVEFDTTRVLTMRKNIQEGTGELLLSIARSNRNLTEQLDQFMIYLFGLTGIAILIMGVVVFSISTLMLKPLKNIIINADHVNASESMERLPIPKTNDETKQLAITLNSMIARIENSLNTQLQFFDSATHELKTPLAIMKAQLTLGLSNENNQSGRKLLGSVLEEVERLEQTIGDFLLLSQLKSNNLVVRNQTVDLTEIIFTSVANIKKLAEQKNISFQVNQTETSFLIEVDKEKLQAVIFNVLENAVQYSPADSVVSIRLSRNGGKISLEIENPTGERISNLDALGKQRYIKSSSVRGMGLGLWICNQMVSILKGELTLSQTDSSFLARLRFDGVKDDDKKQFET